MNILSYCLRSTVNSTMARTYTMQCCYRGSVNHGKRALLATGRCPALASNRCFMKKIGLKSIYDVYSKKAARDNVSPAKYELIYNGVGETYVRWLSGMVIAAVVCVPSMFVVVYVYLLYTEGQIDFKTYLDILLIPHSAVELTIMLTTLFCLKLASFSFISKFVLRIYKHNTEARYVGVFINPYVPWKNVTCTFDRAVKLPNGKIRLIPWYEEYYKLAGHTSIVLRDRFRRPIDYDRMMGSAKTIDE